MLCDSQRAGFEQAFGKVVGDLPRVKCRVPTTTKGRPKAALTSAEKQSYDIIPIHCPPVTFKTCPDT